MTIKHVVLKKEDYPSPTVVQSIIALIKKDNGNNESRQDHKFAFVF